MGPAPNGTIFSYETLTPKQLKNDRVYDKLFTEIQQMSNTCFNNNLNKNFICFLERSSSSVVTAYCKHISLASSQTLATAPLLPAMTNDCLLRSTNSMAG